MTEAQKKELAKLKKEARGLTGKAKARVQAKIDRLEGPRGEKPLGRGKMKPRTRTPQKETTADRKTGSGRGQMGRTERVEPAKKDKPVARGQMKRKPATAKTADKPSGRKTGLGRGQMGRNPRETAETLSVPIPGEVRGRGQMKRRGPGPKLRGPGLPGKKEEEFKGIDAPRRPKLEPLGPTKDIKQRPEPKGPRDQNLRPIQAEKEMRPKGPDTSPRKKPGRFSEERFAKFFKDNFGVTLTFDADDERQAMEDRGEGPSRAKGGFVTRRGGMYNKPVRKK